MAQEVAIFAAGCFWGVETDFAKVDGVTDTKVGYTDGHKNEPTYEQVCSDNTGHAEAVQVTYDPKQVGFEQLLDIFWTIHDPTQLNRQGPDNGSQYRSAIFFTSPDQEKQAMASKEKLDASGTHANSVVTLIEPASTFWLAEDYHQQYFAKKGMDACPTNLVKG